jgi:hypothetical protein
MYRKGVDFSLKKFYQEGIDIGVRAIISQLFVLYRGRGRVSRVQARSGRY